MHDDDPTGAAPTLAALTEAEAARLDAAGVAYGHGTLQARDEAIWLALAALGLPVDGFDDHAADRLDAGQAARVRELVDRRIATRRPTAYLVQQAWLQGVPFYVDERAIVPRSFIAELIADATLDPWLDARTHRVLDLCTGNGSLAVLAAMAWPEVAIDASDLSRDALAVARINVERHGLAERIRLVESDGLAALPGPYDLVLCNPPYVTAEAMARLPAEFRAEPALALAGGVDGMDFIRALLRDLPDRLSDHGVLVLEIGHELEAFTRAFRRLEVVGLATSAGDDQVLLVTAAALKAWAKSASRSS